MLQEKEYQLLQAAEYWSKGEALEAGKLIYENLPPESRVRWAVRILELVLKRSGIESSPFKQVLAAPDHEDMWKNGHQIFSTLRNVTLKLDNLRKSGRLSEDEKLFASILSLAELVAKVIYNATNPPDEFDEDSGWWIAACLRGFVDHQWSDERFAKAAWSALCSQDG